LVVMLMVSDINFVGSASWYNNALSSWYNNALYRPQNGDVET
jgi:hypothetical protein